VPLSVPNAVQPPVDRRNWGIGAPPGSWTETWRRHAAARANHNLRHAVENLLAVRDHFFAIGGRTIALSRRHMAVFEAAWLQPRAQRRNGSTGVRTKSGGMRETI
jgi:hypothetical protein